MKLLQQCDPKASKTLDKTGGLDKRLDNISKMTEKLSSAMRDQKLDRKPTTKDTSNYEREKMDIAAEARGPQGDLKRSRAGTSATGQKPASGSSTESQGPQEPTQKAGLTAAPTSGLNSTNGNLYIS